MIMPQAMIRDGAFEVRVPPGRYRLTGTMMGDNNNYYSISTVAEVPPQGLQDFAVQAPAAPGKVTAHVRIEGR